MNGLQDFLDRLDRLPRERELVAWLPLDPDDVHLLAAKATGDLPTGVWGQVAAVRLLGHAGGPVAGAALARILGESEDPDDRLAAEALVAVEAVGPQALDPLLKVLRLTPPGRELSVEAALKLISEFQATPDALRALRIHLENRFRHARHVGDRILFAGYLGDLGDPAALGTLLEAVSSPHLDPREYEALREAVERLGEECPAVYFDSEAHPYPVDDEGLLRCSVCGATLHLHPETGRPVHKDGSPGRH